METKLFNKLEQLKDLSYIPDSPKKQVMEKNVVELEKLQQDLKDAQIEYENAKVIYERPIEITNAETYKLRKEVSQKMAEAENKLTTIKSKLSKVINDLLFDHVCKSDKHKDLSVAELYSIINAYEHHEFQDNYFPASRLRQLNRNNTKYYKYKFQLEVMECGYQKKLSLGNRFHKSIKTLKGLIEMCENRKEALNDTFRAMQYAKLIKQYDLLTKKTNKTENRKNIESEYVIDFENVQKYYYNKWMATKILKGIDLKIKQGEFVVILGPSGSGKTTLLNIMSGMDKATYGRTIVNGNNLIKMTDAELTVFRKDNIGYIFQQYGLLPNLNVRENIEIGANLQSDKSKRLNIDELLRTVGMFQHAEKFPFELSGGQQQRVSVARSMAKNPAIVFGDEPTGAVDEEMSKQILQLFVDINKKYNTTIIIVTHNPIFADLASRVIKVNSGLIASNYENKVRKSVEELDWSSNH